MEPATSGNPEAAISEARALLAQGQPAEAARKLRLHLSTRPGSATEQMLLGVALTQSGEGLAALQAFEQAVAMEPENPAAHYNLGQAYREFGRHREALAELERALQLRPDYPAAARAAADLRERLAPPPVSSAPPAAPSPAAPAAPPEPAWVPLATEPVDERPLLSRLMAAVWQLLVSPGRAVNGGLDSFFNTPGAAGAVVVFYLFSAAISAGFSLISAPKGAGAVLVIAVLAGLISVAATAFTIATFNRLTGGIDDFAGDFGSLALSFALIQATLSLVAAPVIPLAGQTGAGTGLAVFIGLWTYALEVALVMATTDINLITAMVLLGAANVVAQIATGVVFGAAFGVLLRGAQ